MEKSVNDWLYYAGGNCPIIGQSVSYLPIFILVIYKQIHPTSDNIGQVLLI